MKIILNKWIEDMMNKKSISYFNKDHSESLAHIPFSKSDILDAYKRLNRFSPYLEKTFQDLEKTKGKIDSELKGLENFKRVLGINGNLYLKMDSHLPISASVKARGGIYEVLKIAEKIAIDNNLIKHSDNYHIFSTDKFKSLFSKYKISVGSTGNLGLSIGIMAAKLGFQAEVHMSADAKEWKKRLLRKRGAVVIEYPDDYEKAVASGRSMALRDDTCYFIDDENSVDLFLGYSVAGKHLYDNLKSMNINVSEDNPINIYIPCGVGGAPAGIAFGIKTYFGHLARIYFAEPVNAPCMSLGIISKHYHNISIKDIGLDCKTLADGLAVPRASSLVSPFMATLVNGLFTIDDYELIEGMKNLYKSENIFIEPSACATFNSILSVEKELMSQNEPIGTHILWATGGNMVPDEEREYYLGM